MKAYLGTPPLLSKPKEGEELYLYLVVSPSANSFVLVREEDWMQKPMYYTAKFYKMLKQDITDWKTYFCSCSISQKGLTIF